jgi:DNA invertase Pin-like site-specific DNA recombinase
MKATEEQTCIIYCRVSSHDQVEGTSLTSQEQLCREHAERRGITVLAVFIERGESAKTADRTELNRALEFCRRHKPNQFLVYKLDRFTRNQYDHVTLRAVLRRSNTDLRSVTEPIDDSPVGKLIEGVLSSVSQFDNDQRTERVILGMRARLKEGIWLWPAPLGYYRPQPGENIKPDPQAGPLVRLAFEEYAKGTYTFKSLARMLTNRGLKARQGGPITASRAQQLIQNRVYTGIMSVWGQEYEGTFTPLVSQSTWEACQPSGRSADKVKPRSMNNPLFPLRGFIICSECKTALTGSRSKGRGGDWFPYYHHYNRDCGRSRFIPKAAFEDLFVSFLQRWTLREDTVESFRLAVMEVWNEGKRELSDANAVIRREVAALTAERQRIFDLHRAGTYSDEEFVEQRGILDRRIQQKNRSLRGGSDFDYDLDGALRYCLSFLNDPASTWLGLEDDYHVRLQFQEFLLKGLGKIEYDGDQLRTAGKPLFYELVDGYDGQKSKLVGLLRDRWGEFIDDLRKLREFEIGSFQPPPPAA